MNFHNMTQKNLFESYITPSPVISRCYSTKAIAYSKLQENSFNNGYLGNMRHFNKKNTPFGTGHLKMPPLDHRTNEFCDPLVKIVGGFVGSKSQVGSTNHRGREFSLWDVIVDKIIETTMEGPESRHQGSRKAEHSKKNKFGSITMISVRQFGPESASGTGPGIHFNCLAKEWYPPADTHLNVPRDAGPFHTSDDTQHLLKNLTSFCSCKNDLIDETDTCKRDTVEKECPACPIQLNSDLVPGPVFSSSSSPSCARNASKEIQHPAPVESVSQVKIVPNASTPVAVPNHTLRPEAAEFTPRSRTSLESESDDSIPDVLSSSCESQTLSDTFLRPHVQRTLSECSVDSDDSFIVFESTEDDSVVASEDSDEDSGSEEDLDEIDNPILFSHNVDFSQPLPYVSRLEEANKKWAEAYHDDQLKIAEPASKKVNFAAGNDLVQVKRLITWDFAHRAARKGPWEMYHWDSERFKRRIASLSVILSPVLVKKHRDKIYAERFQT